MFSICRHITIIIRALRDFKKVIQKLAEAGDQIGFQINEFKIKGSNA